MIKNLFLIAALTTSTTGLSLAFSPSALALQYNLSNVLFVGTDTIGLLTGNVTGSFDFDGTTYSNVNLAVTGTAGFGTVNRYDGVFATQDILLGANQSDASKLFVRIGLPSGSANFRRLDLGFSQALTGTAPIGTNVPLTLNSPFSRVVRGLGGGNNDVLRLTAGSVQAVPLESDALSILGATAFLGGGLWFKRRRAQSKVNLSFLEAPQTEALLKK